VPDARISGKGVAGAPGRGGVICSKQPHAPAISAGLGGVLRKIEPAGRPYRRASCNIRGYDQDSAARIAEQEQIIPLTPGVAADGRGIVIVS
jgi:hypothetical protein